MKEQVLMPASFLRPRNLTGPLWPLLLKAAGTLLKPVKLIPVNLELQHELSLSSPQHLAQYQRLLGYPADRLPLCWFYPLLQKAQLASMLQLPGLPVAGLIHLSNSLRLHGPITANSVAQMNSLTQSHWRLGTKLELTQRHHWQLSAVQQLFSNEQLLLSCSSEYLVKKMPNAPVKPNLPPVQQAGLVQQWVTDTKLARHYAALSGDWNPIHLWHWSARLFGQRQPILHGMASAALLEARLPNAAQALRVDFIKPIYPGQLLELRQQNAEEYWLCQQNRICLRAYLA